MEKFRLEEDIHVLGVRATSFPTGVLVAFEKLHSTIPDANKRRSFGLSRPENNEAIVYRAAAEEKKRGEAEQFGLESIVIRKGDYASIVLYDFMKDMASVGRAFTEILALPGIDPEGYCVEFYFDETDVRCMVRMEG